MAKRFQRATNPITPAPVGEVDKRIDGIVQQIEALGQRMAAEGATLNSMAQMTELCGQKAAALVERDNIIRRHFYGR